MLSNLLLAQSTHGPLVGAISLPTTHRQFPVSGRIPGTERYGAVSFLNGVDEGDVFRPGSEGIVSEVSCVHPIVVRILYTKMQESSRGCLAGGIISYLQPGIGKSAFR